MNQEINANAKPKDDEIRSYLSKLTPEDISRLSKADDYFHFEQPVFDKMERSAIVHRKSNKDFHKYVKQSHECLKVIKRHPKQKFVCIVYTSTRKGVGMFVYPVAFYFEEDFKHNQDKLKVIDGCMKWKKMKDLYSYTFNLVYTNGGWQKFHNEYKNLEIYIEDALEIIEAMEKKGI
jgi:hypothetical protein